MVVAGGVAANGRIRALAEERCAAAGLTLRVPRPGLCTDNGAMIAAVGAQVVAAGGRPSSAQLGGDPGLPVSTVYVPDPALGHGRPRAEDESHADGLLQQCRPPFLDEVREAPGAKAGDLLTGALYGVLSADGEVSVDAADRALVAVTLLLVERAPEVVDDAPDPDGLRAYLADLDTELTPARITAARGVLGRLLVPSANAWYDAHDAGRHARRGPAGRARRWPNCWPTRTTADCHRPQG